MNLIKISTKFISLLPFILILSCSTNKPLQTISVVSFTNDISVNEGDSSIIKWNFSNAENVYFDGFPQRFNSLDSISISALNDTTYSIIATNPIDTQTVSVHIFVNHLVKEIQTGAEINSKRFTEPSLENSEYLNGILPSSVRSSIKYLKIIRSQFLNNSLTLNLLPLDEFGNFITNLNLDSLNLTFDAISYGMKLSFNQKLIQENHFTDSAKPISIYFLLENSLAAFESDKVCKQIRTALGNFENKDRVSIATFNQNTDFHFENEQARNAYTNFSPVNANPSGTAAYSSAIINTLQKIKNVGEHHNNIIILLAYSEENSSITSTLDEALQIASTMQVPIYLITLSRDYKSYQMNAIADATGGILYSVEPNQFDKISKIISEIYFAQKVNYQYRLNFLNEISNYPEISIKSTVYSNNKFIDGAKKCYSKVPEIYIPYQILSIFDYSSKEVPQSYFKKLGELSQLLKDNPKSVSEISAYSYFEIDSAMDYDLSLERAQNIRQILIDSGASSEQIRLKARGNENPLFYIPTKEWQMSYNRRAELRWLDPEFLPFEIIAQSAVSENDALSKVENWEKLGFRSYYQRYIINNDVRYRIKLWGYSTEQEVQDEIKKLQGRFPDVHFELE